MARFFCATHGEYLGGDTCGLQKPTRYHLTHKKKKIRVSHIKNFAAHGFSVSNGFF